jgi:hypothetical protein
VVRPQATARRLLSAAQILRTREQNQNVFTVERIGVKGLGIEICSTVAVTAEKKVATVARFRILSASRLCSYCIAGSPVSPCERILRMIVAPHTISLEEPKSSDNLVYILAHSFPNAMNVQANVRRVELICTTDIEVVIDSKQTAGDYLGNDLSRKHDTVRRGEKVRGIVAGLKCGVSPPSPLQTIPTTS